MHDRFYNPQAKQMADESIGCETWMRRRAPSGAIRARLGRYAAARGSPHSGMQGRMGEGASRLAGTLSSRSRCSEWTRRSPSGTCPPRRYAILAAALTFEHQSIFELKAADRSFDLT